MRQFVAEEELDSKGCLLVTGKKFRYLTSVLRSVPGDMILVRLPSGALQQMTLACVDNAKKSLVLQVAGETYDSGLHALPVENKSSVELWLFQFIAKPAKMELILRQAVECGVAHFVPVAGEFSQGGNIESAKKHTEKNDFRWERIITEAMEQSGSPVKTEVHTSCTLEEAINLWKENCGSEEEKLGLVLYEQNKDSLSLHRAVLEQSRRGEISKAVLVCGAEGGISPEEIESLKKSGFVSVHFSTNILRCETAALYGIASLETALFEMEDWRCKE